MNFIKKPELTLETGCLPYLFNFQCSRWKLKYNLLNRLNFRTICSAMVPFSIIRVTIYWEASKILRLDCMQGIYYQEMVLFQTVAIVLWERDGVTWSVERCLAFTIFSVLTLDFVVVPQLARDIRTVKESERYGHVGIYMTHSELLPDLRYGLHNNVMGRHFCLGFSWDSYFKFIFGLLQI